MAPAQSRVVFEEVNFWQITLNLSNLELASGALMTDKRKIQLLLRLNIIYSPNVSLVVPNYKATLIRVGNIRNVWLREEYITQTWRKELSWEKEKYPTEVIFKGDWGKHFLSTFKLLVLKKQYSYFSWNYYNKKIIIANFKNDKPW